MIERGSGNSLHLVSERATVFLEKLLYITEPLWLNGKKTPASADRTDNGFVIGRVHEMLVIIIVGT